MSDELQILLVEDDEDARSNLADILELDGHQIHFAGSFAEVRRQGHRQEISLVILDRRLPDGVAEEALPGLKEILPNAEFIVVTGYADMENTIAALQLGVVDYILKPIYPDVIRTSVSRIAKQKRTEHELNKEQKFASQVLSTAEAVVLVLDREGRVTRFNSFFTQITGWRRQDLYGKSWFEHCIPERDRQRIREVFDQTIRDVETTGVLNPVLTHDGRRRQIRWSNTALQNDDDGEATSVLAIGVDVTNLIEAQQLAGRSQRLAAIGQTVAGLAHESRNALHRIQASVEILQLDIPPESDLREEVDSIQRASIELHNTLEEVRHYAAPIHLHRECASLPAIWRRVWGYLRPQRADRETELVEQTCDGDFQVDVDVMRMEQVFRNLFENALAACSDPVRIFLECYCDGQDGVILDIEDNGPGLNSEQKEKLFEPFFTTKVRGTGLGMSIVQRILDAHGGTIQVAEPKRGETSAGDPPTSEPQSRGARFLIRLVKREDAYEPPCQQQKEAGHA